MYGIKSTSKPSSGMWSFQVRVRPVGAPEHAGGKDSTMQRAKGNVAVGLACRFQRLRDVTLRRSGQPDLPERWDSRA